jgi:hypothetical protein
MMQTNNNKQLFATSGAPSLLHQVGMAGGAAVITVSFIHPIDVIKVRTFIFRQFDGPSVLDNGAQNAFSDSLFLEIITTFTMGHGIPQVSFVF